MVEYVRGSRNDMWHWCKNCTQYPMYIYQKVSVKPPNLCEQCKTKQENGNCQCEEINCAIIESHLKRDFTDFCYSTT